MKLHYPPLVLPDGILRIDNSALEDFCTCPRLYAYKHVWKRIRAGTVAARDAGRAIHAALQVWHTGGGLEAAQAALRTGYEGVQIDDGDHRTLGRMLDVMSEYGKFWGADARFEVLAAEVPLEWPLGEVLRADGSTVRVHYTGRMDLMVRWLDGPDAGQVMVADHKSMAQWRDDEQMNTYLRSSQMKGYAWMVQEIARAGRWSRTSADVWAPGIQIDAPAPVTVHGFLLNAIVIRSAGTSGRTKLARQEFRRPKFYYLPSAIAQWQHNALAKVAALIRCADAGEWPEYEGSCANQWGRACSHLEVCDGPPEQVPLALSMDRFADNVWNPLIKQKGE